MRNLKRAFSLGMTAAMISSLMVVGSSAASYSDVTSEDHQEAIEVLKAVGVMVGDENGNFNPDSKVTRNEMAVVISNLMDYNVATYKGTSPFTDVPSWAEPYVAACYTNGNTAGYTATYYGGSDNVTTGQAALMLMKALGYFQYQSDFEDDWQLATTKQANKIDLFDDVDAAVREDITRNELAQLVLNTLEAGMVEADNDVTKVEAGDVKVETGKVNYNYVSSTEKYAEAIKGGTKDIAISSTTISTNGHIVQLGEKLFDGDLKKTDGTTDDFGRPATEWKYGTETVGTFGDDADTVWTAKVTKKALYEATTKSVVDDLEDGDYTLYYYVDGVETKVAKSDIDSFMDKNNTEKINDDKDTGNGTVTELYVDDDEDEVTVVVINTYVFQATEDYNTKTEDVNVSAVGDTAITLDSYDLDSDDFAITDVAEDDYLLITASHTSSNGKYEVQTVDKAELVSGEVSEYSSQDDVTIDGTTYKYNATTKKDGVRDEITSTGGETTLVLDKYGYIVAVDDTIVGGNYVFITDTDRSLGNAVSAYAYFSDGTVSEISLKKVATSTKASDLEAARGWYTYTVDSNNKYTLTAISGSYATVDNMSSKTTETYAGQDILVNGSAKLPVSLESKSIRTNDKTIFVIVDDDGDVTTYTGVSKAPDITVAAGNKENIEMGYVYKTSNNYATYVFINADDASASVDSSTENDTYVFLTELDKTRDNGTDTYYVYKAVVDGVDTTVETDDKYDVMKLYTKVKVDSSTDRITDMYELDVSRTDSTWAKQTVENAEVTYSNGVLTIGDDSFVVNSDSKLSMVLDPSSDSDVKALMSDQGEDYEVYDSVGGNALKNQLNGYKVSGYWYVVTEDDNNWSGNKGSNSTVDYLYLYINGAEASTTKEEATTYTVSVSSENYDVTSGTGSYEAGKDVTLTLTQKVAADLSDKSGVTVSGVTASTVSVTTTGVAASDEKYVEATGLTEFASGVTYYTKAEDSDTYTEASEYTAGTTYYTKTAASEGTKAVITVTFTMPSENTTVTVK